MRHWVMDFAATAAEVIQQVGPLIPLVAPIQGRHEGADSNPK
jgi:hypothetical protein